MEECGESMLQIRYGQVLLGSMDGSRSQEHSSKYQLEPMAESGESILRAKCLRGQVSTHYGKELMVISPGLVLAPSNIEFGEQLSKLSLDEARNQWFVVMVKG